MEPQELISVASLDSQVVIVVTMVISMMIGTALSSGVQLRSTASTPGTATWTMAVAVSTVTTAHPIALSRPVILFVASWIDCL